MIDSLVPTEVILVVSSTKPVGVSTYILGLVRIINKSNIKLRVILPDEGWLFQKLTENNVNVSSVKLSTSFAHIIRSNIILYKAIGVAKTDDCRIIHLNGRLTVISSIFSLFFRKNNVHYIATMHQYIDNSRYGLKGIKRIIENVRVLMENIILKSIDGIICISRGIEAEAINRKLNTKKIIQIDNWLPLISNHEPKRIFNNIVRIVGIGRLNKIKGFDILINAVIGINEKERRCIVDIYGDGPEFDSLNAMIEQNKCSEYVQLKGVTYNSIETIQQYDIMVIPSRIEPFGLVVLEGFQAGVPVIISDVPGMNEIVGNEKTGLKFKSEDVSDLISKILYMINNQEKAFSCAINAQQDLRTKYNEDRAYTDYINYYKKYTCKRS